MKFIFKSKRSAWMNGILSAIILSFPTQHFAQPTDHNLLQAGYLFSKSVPGTVLFKSSRVEKAVLNYDTNGQAIIFEQAGKFMELTGLDAIDTIFIQERKFIPSNNLVYEWISGQPAAGLYITYTNKWVPLEATADHNGTASKPSGQVSNTVSNIYMGRPFKKDHSLQVVKNYWLRIKDKFYKANNEKSILRALSNTSGAVRDYIFEQKIDVHIEPDLIKLVAFYNTLL